MVLRAAFQLLVGTLQKCIFFRVLYASSDAHIDDHWPLSVVSRCSPDILAASHEDALFKLGDIYYLEPLSVPISLVVNSSSQNHRLDIGFLVYVRGTTSAFSSSFFFQ